MDHTTLEASAYLAETHLVENQPPPLRDYNPYLQDAALCESVAREGAAWAEPMLQAFGTLTGSREVIELGFAANENKPVLFTHDSYGHRIDEVRFHPAYHRLMDISMEHGLHAAHWRAPRAGAHVARAAMSYLQGQVDAAHGCPVTMTSAVVPALLEQPDLAAQWLPKITALAYDPRNIPMERKAAITVGMAMTEKQGGSDVRSNTLRAHALGVGGPGQVRQVGVVDAAAHELVEAFGKLLVDYRIVEIRGGEEQAAFRHIIAGPEKFHG